MVGVPLLIALIFHCVLSRVWPSILTSYCVSFVLCNYRALLHSLFHLFDDASFRRKYWIFIMPSGAKANKFMNRHAVEAREREQERSAQIKAKKRQEEEDALWAESDAKALKKQAKQREAEEKAQRQAEQRALKKELLLQEEQELSAKVPQKVSRRQMQKDLSKMLADYDRKKQVEPRENRSQLAAGGAGDPSAGNLKKPGDWSKGGAVAEGPLNEALSALQLRNPGEQVVPEDRHIGKRARVLYRLFCEEQLPRLREERPGLRRSQYNDLLWEMWQKDSSNPFVQRNERRSADRLEQERRWIEGDDDEEGEEEDSGQ